MVFVHGWACNRSCWDAQIPHFSRSGKVVSIDLAGHGESYGTRSEWTIDAYAKDVSSVVRKLELNSIILVGHSMGALVSIAVADELSDELKGVVIVDEITNVEEKYSQEEMAYVSAVLADNFETGIQNFVREAMFLPNSDANLVDRVASSIASADPEVVIGSLGDGGYYDFFNNDMMKLLTRIEVPIAFVNSDIQPTASDVNRQHLPSLKMHTMPGVGHFVMMEDPVEFNRILDEFINSL